MGTAEFLYNYFSVQAFFIIFREAVETALIVSVMLSMLHQGFTSESGAAAESFKTISRWLALQVWVGAALGLAICGLVGGIIIYAFYFLGTNLWDYTEKLWEAVFSLVAAAIITVMGMAMLRINGMREKWKVKLAARIIDEYAPRKAGYQSLAGISGPTTTGPDGTVSVSGAPNAQEENEIDDYIVKVRAKKSRNIVRNFTKKYWFGILPFITTLREGLEAVVFLGGIGASQPATSFILPSICALILGTFVGLFLYRSGNHLNLTYFLIASTCFLYMIAAGLVSRGVWFIELQHFINQVGMDISESGSGPGSYNVNTSVWHVNCCNPQTDGPYMILNALVGWQNSATYGSVISYNLYWWFVAAMVLLMKYRDTHGRLPWAKTKSHKKRKWTAAEAEEMMARAARVYHAAHVRSRNSEDSITSTTPLASAAL